VRHSRTERDQYNGASFINDTDHTVGVSVCWMSCQRQSVLNHHNWWCNQLTYNTKVQHCFLLWSNWGVQIVKPKLDKTTKLFNWKFQRINLN